MALVSILYFLSDAVLVSHPVSNLHYILLTLNAIDPVKAVKCGILLLTAHAEENTFVSPKTCKSRELLISIVFPIDTHGIAKLLSFPGKSVTICT